MQTPQPIIAVKLVNLILIALLSMPFGGHGQIQFEPKVAYPLTSPTGLIVSGDLDGDNIDDLVVPNGNLLTIYLGTGTGSFTFHQDIDLSNSTAGTVIHDFNGDNIPDLVVANTFDFRVNILWGSGGGNYLPPEPYFINSPQRIVTADFNGDSFYDWAISTPNGITIVLATGSGTFGPDTNYPAGTNPLELVTRDFDSDGDIDLAIQSDFELIIMLGNGDGTFSNGQTITLNGSNEHVISEDFNGDGFLDLLAGNGSEVSLIRGFGDGSFDAPQIAASVSADGLAARDINSDGILDFSAANGNAISTYIGDGTGAFIWSQNFGAGQSLDQFLIADLDANGLLDFVSTSRSLQYFYVALGSVNTLAFNPQVDHSTGGASQGRDVKVADIDGDGNLDIICPNINSSSIGVLKGTGLGCFSNPQTFSGTFLFSAVEIADLNADGKIDMVSANGTSRTVSVYINIGTGFLPKVDYISATPAPGGGSTDLAIGDVNSDGNPDLVVVNNDSPGSISVLTGVGDGTFNAMILYPATNQPVSLALGDVNGDNKLDVAVANPNNYMVGVFINDGAGAFPTETYYYNGYPTDILFGDFNNDTHLDIATTNPGNSVGLMLNDGTGLFADLSVFSAFPGYSQSQSLVAGDMDNDGNLDIVAASGTSMVSVILGDGQGGFISGQNYNASTNTFGVDIGDFDEDGKLDILALNANFFSTTVSVIRTSTAACIPPPAISSFFPSSGAPGTVAFIYGNNFSDTAGDNNVKFNGVTATVEYSNCCFLRVVVPAGATTGNITVQVGLSTGISNTPFTIPPLTIAGFTPVLAITGETVTISGTGFSPVPTMNVVNFNGAPAVVSASTAGSISTTVPVGATTGPITVQVGAQTATSVSNFTVFLPPVVSSFTPAIGVPGTSVTISGVNFDPVLSNNTVRFNGLAATITGGTTTSLTVDVPVSAVNGKISVTVSGYTGTSVANFSVITPNPTITGFSPATGPIGTTVTITGTNFNLIPANNIVRFGTVGATVSSVTATSLQVNVPMGASYNPISLTINEFQCESKVPFITTFESFRTIDINSFTPMTFGSPPSRRAVSGDINGDGTIDYVIAIMNFPVYDLRVVSGSQFVNLPTAVSSLGEALQDINGDGKPDLLAVTGNGFGNTLHIFRNTSVPGVINSGTFAPRVDLAYGNANRILIKDIDGDGRPDVVRSQNTPAFVVHKNSSQFGVIDATTLATQVTIATTSNITIIDAGDVDGDGKPDLVTSGGSFFRNTSTPGTISFDPKQDLISGTQVFAIADINRDEKLDVIGNNGVLLNTSVPGTFSFAPIVSISITSPFSVKVADLDGDGLPDLAYAANRISVVKNTSTATTASFLPKVDFGDTYDYFGTNQAGGLHSILDMDGDGKLDLLYVTGGSIINALITGSPSRVPIVSGFSPASGPVGTTVTINGSNFSATPSNNIVYFGAVRASVISSSTSSISVTVPTGVTDQPISVTANGFTGTSGKPFVLLFNTDGVINTSSFAVPISYGAWSYPLGLSIGDVNADGKPDIASADAAGSAVSVFQNNTTVGVFSASSLLSLVTYNTGAGPSEVELVDMDGDGKLDLVSTCDTPSLPNGRVSVNRNVTGTGTINSSFFGGAAQSLANFRPEGLAVGDVDGDGKPEMAAVTLTEDRAHVYKNFNLGTVKSSHRENLAILTSYIASGVAFSDIDVDGKLDLIVTYDGAFISIFRNTSIIGEINPSSFGARIDIPLPFATGFARIAVGDLDGDGRPDIVKPNPSNNTISIFRNISNPGLITAGSFDTPFALSTGVAPSSASIGDLDGDGKREIAVTNETSNTISLFKNVSLAGALDASSFLPKVDIAVPAGPRRIAIGDLDGDTKPDLVVSSPGADVISILHNEKVLLGGAAPTITSFSPTSAVAGATVTITGTDLTGAVAVGFGGTAAASFTVTSSTTIDAVVGAGTSGIVSVTTVFGTATLTGFIFNAPPTVSSFSPTSAGNGTTVDITGTNFSGTTGVSFGGVSASSFTVNSPTSISATVAGGASGSVLITTPFGIATLAGFTFSSAQTIAISPQPFGVSTCDGTTALFTTDATGTANLVYQWQKFDGSAYNNIADGAGYSGTGTTTLSVNTTGNFGAGDYRCKVSGDAAPDVFSVPATLTINPIPGAPSSPVDGNSCGPGAVPLSVSGAVNGEYRWYTTSTGGTAIAGEVNAAFTTPTLTTTTSYFASININSCESTTRTLVIATINTVPGTPGAVPNFHCGPGSVWLGATGATNGQYRWYAAAVGGTAFAGEVNSTYPTPVLAGTTSYFVSINDGTCESLSRTEVVATINPIPPDPTAPTATGPLCSGSTFTFSTTGALPGEYRWYTVPTGGASIAGETNGSYAIALTTSSNLTYYVSVMIGGCESGRQSATAVVTPLPSPPTASTPAPICPGNSTTLTASGTTNGNYRWYDGTVIIPGEVNSTYQTPLLTANRNFGVSIFDGTCESLVTPIVASVQVCSSPVIATNVSAPFLPTVIRINLALLLSDPENNLNLSTLQIISGLPSGATATIEGTELVIDYSGITFPGIETIVLRVCDLTGLCTDETLTINLSSEIGIYNAMSPNSDGKNEMFYIENIDKLPDTKENKVTIFNRWGSVVFETTNYDNADKVFKGFGNNGSELPPGTYYYSIEFSSGAPKRTGFISLRK